MRRRPACLRGPGRSRCACSGYRNTESCSQSCCNQQNPLADVDRDFSRTADHRRQSGTNQLSVRPNPGTFFTPDGPLRPPPGTNGVGLTPGDFLPGTTASGEFVNRYNFNQRTELIPSSERTGYFGTAEYDINKYVTLFGEGTVEIAADQQHVERADRARQTHVRKRGAESRERDEIARRLAGRRHDAHQRRLE